MELASCQEGLDVCEFKNREVFFRKVTATYTVFQYIIFIRHNST